MALRWSRPADQVRLTSTHDGPNQLPKSDAGVGWDHETLVFLLCGIGCCGGTLDLQASACAGDGSGHSFPYLRAVVNPDSLANQSSPARVSCRWGGRHWARPVARRFSSAPMFFLAVGSGLRLQALGSRLSASGSSFQPRYITSVSRK